MPTPVLETERLILRPPLAEDFDAWAEMMEDGEVARFLGGAQPRAGAWRGFIGVAGAWAIQGFAMFSVIEKSTGRWIGRLGPWQPEGWPGTEIGWGLHRAAWGRGYATEGTAATIDWAFDHLGWTEIIHCIAPENEPSKAVARRLGSIFHGPGRLPAPHDGKDYEIWGQSRQDWRCRAPSRQGAKA